MAFNERMLPGDALDLLQDVDEMDSDGGPDGEMDIDLQHDLVNMMSTESEEEEEEEESESGEHHPGPAGAAALGRQPKTTKGAKKRGKKRGGGASSSFSAQHFHERMQGATGPTEEVRKSIRSRLDSFLCLCSVEMLEHIRECTVAEARRTSPDWELSLAELKAFIAFMYKSNYYFDLRDFWEPKFPKHLPPKERLKEIADFLRFDHREERAARRATDKFALVSQVWESFVENSAACYVPGQRIIVDEQLYPLKFRCPFIQYMPKNFRNKLGIKFLLAADAESSYVVNGLPCLETGYTDPPERAELCADVLRLLEPLVGKGRRVKTGRSFKSRSLTDQLMEKETSITYVPGGVGTLNDLAAEYSLGVPVCRWPAAVFCNILSLVVINAYVLYTQCTGRSEHRDVFATKLVLELCQDYKKSKKTKKSK